MRERRPDPPPLRTDDVRVVAFGTASWALAFVVLLPFRDRLQQAGREWWLGACLAGFALGLLGLAYVRRRARAIARDEALDRDRHGAG